MQLYLKLSVKDSIKSNPKPKPNPNPNLKAKPTPNANPNPKVADNQLIIIRKFVNNIWDHPNKV